MSRDRVLLLEDDLSLRGLLIEALAGEGFDVQACDSFPQIRNAAAEGQGDVVVADFWGVSQHTLPDAERQEIRQLGALVPLVLLTGRSWAVNMSARDLGAGALIRKPFDLDELLQTIERVLTETAHT